MSARTKLGVPRGVPRVLAGFGLMSAAGLADAAYDLNLPRGVTPISREVFDLHMLVLWVCVAIGIVVFSAMFYSIIRHRKSKGAVAAKFHESTVVEVLWTIVPFLILIGMAIPATKTLIAMEDTRNADVSIKVTGYQWKWRYDYLDDGVGFFSTLSTPKDEIFNRAEKNPHYLLEVDHPMVVPVNKKVRLLITANDVIHSWWVPVFGMKKDAIPGFVNEMWINVDTPGTYRGQCAELCGKDHGFMPIVVVAKEQPDYDQWLADQQQASAVAAADSDREFSKDELMARGEKVFTANCAACHQANGEGVPGAFPALKGGVIATGPVPGHLDIVLHGKSGTAMAAFGSQLNDADLAAVITYERNAWGNDTGDVVQPADVKAAR
ncbi:MAG: cytochrome c oxidase subunit II [Gammaproteobacteria bacterium]|nr:cytochrome c oxidase subunit II [Gammaproteobacteria bacterium]